MSSTERRRWIRNAAKPYPSPAGLRFDYGSGFELGCDCVQLRVKRISARSSSVGIGILAMFTFTPAGWFHPCSCAALLTTSFSLAEALTTSSPSRSARLTLAWIVDAHRGDGRRFIVHAHEKLSAFVELERQALTVTFYLEAICACG